MPDPTPPDEKTQARPVPADAAPTGAAGASVTSPHVPSASGSAASRTTPVRIGKFEVRRLLGEGAFARVYLGFDADLGREVAIKVPKTDEMTAADRDAFIRENRLAAIIHQANICPIFEVGTDGGVPYIVMRFIPDTLAGLLRRHAVPMSAKNALVIARKLAMGLSAAHAQKIIHRDLKPANVLYDEANREVLIADFGLARFVDQATAASNGVPKGTPAYMAPEQARGLADQIGPHSDVYALGIILYEMLTGSVPFKGSVWEVMRDHCETPPKPPSSVRTGIDSRLDALVLKAIAKAPADRYHTAKDFASAVSDYLRALESGTIPPPAGTAPPPAPEPMPLPAEPAAAQPPKPEPTGKSKSGKGTGDSHDVKKSSRKGKEKAARDREPEPKAKAKDKRAAKKKGSPFKWVLIGCGSLAGLVMVLLIAGVIIAATFGGCGSPPPSTFYKTSPDNYKPPSGGGPKSIK